MRAVRIHRYGPPDVLQVDEMDEPVCGPAEVLVDVHAAGVNPIDTKIRCGGQRSVVRLKLPARLGMDLSGVVRAVGERVAGFSVGDEVFGSPSHRRMGAYGEVLAVRADELAKKPVGITHVEAAGLPLAGLTAWDCLVGFADLQAGERVLIQAGAGGVGTLAIQLAKARGAEVFTTCSPRNTELVRDLGADHVIDYRSRDWAEVARGVDIVLESIGGADLDKALTTVRPGGRVAAITVRMPEYTAKYGPTLGLIALGGALLRRIVGSRVGRGVRLGVITRRASGENLARLADLVTAGSLRPVIDRELALEDAVEAHRIIETGRARGKIVLRVR